MADRSARYSAPIDGRNGGYGPMGVADHADGRYSPMLPDYQRQGVIWVLVLAAHLALGWFIAHEPLLLARSSARTEPLVMISLAPHEEAPIGLRMPIRLLPLGRVDAQQPALLDVEVEEGPAGMARHSGSIVPPHPSDTPTDTLSFARQAGLPQGIGATVVLRVQVLGSGAVGRVEIDVSGGSPQVDQAAIAYVRALRWSGGRVDNQPSTLWVRWGVRLDG